MAPQQPPARSSPALTRHVQGQRWPACGCRLCMDAFICPAPVARAGRVLVLAGALGVLGALVSAL